MAQITYSNKTFLNQNASIPEVNKVTDNNMNEIKSVVNQNDTNVGNLSNLKTNDKTSIVNSINEIKDAEIYSTDEVKTNKVWINGAPIYRKVYTGTKTTTRDLNLGTLTGYDKITSIIGILESERNTIDSIPFYYSDNIFLVPFIENNGDIILHGSTSSNYSAGAVTVIIEYTKSTD